LLTDEAREGMDSLMHAPIDPDGREYRNVYEIVSNNHMHVLMDERRFSGLFSIFERLIMNEKKYFEKNTT
jgi:hypothetical protein